MKQWKVNKKMKEELEKREIEFSIKNRKFQKILIFIDFSLSLNQFKIFSKSSSKLSQISTFGTHKRLSGLF